MYNYIYIIYVLTAAISSHGSSQLLCESNAKPVVPSFHVKPSRCITLVDLMVGTGLLLERELKIP